MSAFVGLLILDGTPCPPPIVETMLGRLRHRVDARGWDAKQVRCQNSAGLGYAPLITTPEALQDIERPDEAQTLTHNGHSLSITGDVRLDGRAELIRELGLESEAHAWSDGRLVLEAYARWGQECPSHLRGDFAFGIWDEVRQRLFCARDRFGTKPFYYAYKPGHFFAFANEIKALWPVPGLESAVNETQIAHYLLARFDDKTSTFYRDVRRLSPATSLEVDWKFAGELHEASYYQLDGKRAMVLADDEAYAAMLLERFRDSVRERMRSEGRFAVFLSGGLDSSAIAAVAEHEAPPAQKPVPALSTVFERFSQCDERVFIRQTLACGDFEPLTLVGDDITGLTELERVVWHLDQPAPGPNSCSAWAQYRLLQKAGVKVVLDGHGGDEVVCLGYERLVELMYRGDFKNLWYEARLLHRHHIIEEISPLALVVRGFLLRARGKRGWGRLVVVWSRIQSRRAARLTARRLDAGAGASNSDMELLSARLLRRELASKVREEAIEKPTYDVREFHLRTLDSAIQPLALEVIDAMAGAHALESRCPFWEQEMTETCLAFPAHQKMRHGFNRYVMRRAMEKILPPQVQWRRDKTNFAPQMTESLRVVEGERIERLLTQQNFKDSGLERYVDLDQVRIQWLNLQNAPPASGEAAIAAVLVWRVLTLGTWLLQQSPLGLLPEPQSPN